MVSIFDFVNQAVYDGN